MNSLSWIFCRCLRVQHFLFTRHVTSDKDSWEQRQFVTNLTIAFKGQAIASSCHDPFGTIISALINKVSLEYQLDQFLSAYVSYSYLK